MVLSFVILPIIQFFLTVEMFKPHQNKKLSKLTLFLDLWAPFLQPCITSLELEPYHPMQFCVIHRGLFFFFFFRLLNWVYRHVNPSGVILCLEYVVHLYLHVFYVVVIIFLSFFFFCSRFYNIKYSYLIQIIWEVINLTYRRDRNRYYYTGSEWTWE